jgi:predicted nucleotidyltransferase component of viral defense system
MAKDLALIRKAAQEEMDFYFKVLYPLQDIALEQINRKEFYLTGGTALSRFYYHHRFSDDLDFFYNGYAYPGENFNFVYREIVAKLEKVFDKIEITLDAEFFKRLFVTGNEATLKIEFVYENFKTVGDKKEFKGALIDSRENICANKIGAVMDRRTTKDFLDLFYLLKDVELDAAIEWSELKRVPPDYEGLMIAAGDLLKSPQLLEGEVLTLKEMDNQEFAAFTKKLVGDLIAHAKNG